MSTEYVRKELVYTEKAIKYYNIFSGTIRIAANNPRH